MLIRTSHGILDILYSETDMFYVCVSLCGDNELFETWCTSPNGSRNGELNVELGQYGQFGFAIGSYWPEAMQSYNQVHDMHELFESKLYKSLDELLQRIECSTKESSLSTFLYVLCSLLVKGPLFIGDGMSWYATTLQQTLFEVIGDFSYKNKEPLLQRYAFLFDWTKDLDVTGASHFPWDVAPKEIPADKPKRHTPKKN